MGMNATEEELSKDFYGINLKCSVKSDWKWHVFLQRSAYSRAQNGLIGHPCFLVLVLYSGCTLGADTYKNIASNRLRALDCSGITSSLVIISLGLAIWGLVAFFRE